MGRLYVNGGTFEERFWAHVNKSGPVPGHRVELGPCWVWQGAPNDAGYGMFWVASGDQRRAHRVS